MTEACEKSKDFTTFSIPTLCALETSMKKNSLRVVTVSTRTDRTGQDSTDSASPVKRLITMYNTNGSTSQKAYRKSRARGAEDVECDVSGENDQWFFSAVDKLIDSEENSPRENESDTESDWSPSKSRSIINSDPLLQTDSEVKSESRSPSSILAEDENEIVWEVFSGTKLLCIFSNKIVILTPSSLQQLTDR